MIGDECIPEQGTYAKREDSLRGEMAAIFLRVFFAEGDCGFGLSNWLAQNGIVARWSNAICLLINIRQSEWGGWPLRR